MRKSRKLATFLLAGGLAVLPLMAADAPNAPRSETSFDAGWHFFKGDAPGAEKADFADAAWRSLDLPHDWAIEGPFDENNKTGHGGAYAPSGVGWYRKTFTLPVGDAQKRVFIDFDGVMANSEVWVNGVSLGKRPYGFVSFRYELTGHLNFGADKPNLIAVRTDTSQQPASHFYTGAGIYRHVHLVETDQVHLDHWGVFVTTPTVTTDAATVHVQSTVVNNADKDQSVSLSIVLTGPDGQPATTAPATAPAQTIPAGKSAVFEQDIAVANPKLWDIATPNLYQAKVQVLAGGNTLDAETDTFGIRTFEFKAATGFWLNGKNVPIYGACLHEDGGAFGMAVPARVWEFRLEQLRKMGINAIRTVHNPPAPEFMALCDRMGFLVMEETFDTWHGVDGGATFGYQTLFDKWWDTDTRDIVMRDRNHPSLIVYSTANEPHDDLTKEANQQAFIQQRDLIHKLDATRPVTFAIGRPNDATQKVYDTGFSEQMDIIGQDYRPNELLDAWTAKPARKVLFTANGHALSEWFAMRDNKFVAGEFVWCGADYLGETDWPNLFLGLGMLDHTGQFKNDGWQRATWWSSAPVLHMARTEEENARSGLVPDWSPAEPDNYKHARVTVYSNCDSVELFLNDQSLGVKKLNTTSQALRTWAFDYKPGALKAVGKNGGKVAATEEYHTAGAPAKIVLAPDRGKIADSWDDVSFVTATVVDKDGVPCPNAEVPVAFKISGPGVIAAVDNAANDSHEPFQGSQRTTVRGQCIAYVKATADSGQITLTASAPDLTDGTAVIEAVKSN